MKASSLSSMVLLLSATVPLQSLAADEAGWSVVPYVGLSALSDQSASGTGLAAGDSDVDVLLDNGFTGGLSLRYHYDSPWSTEVGWEYHSNDSEIRLADGSSLPAGNYASNIFYLNGRYDLALGSGAWQPWVGAGLTVVQEIDLDSESDTGEVSFSDSGSVGFQLMAGVNRPISDKWYFTGEIRYSDQRSLTLTQEEGGAGVIDDIDYQPFTVQLGLGYRFGR